MCPLDRLAAVRERMRAPSELFVVDSGDHSLMAQKTRLRQLGVTQPELDEQALAAITAFLDRFAPA
jgi:hypothetical protein